MRYQLARPPVAARGGISLVEVIVVVFVLVLLLSLFLPAVRVSRGVSRRVQCAHNLKNLALATVNFASGKNGQLPLLSEPAPGFAAENLIISAMVLLPYMDRADVVEYICEQKTAPEATAAVGRALNNTYSMLQCPEDRNHFKQPGGLSYGANVGYGAWRGSPEGVITGYDFGASDHSAAAIDWNNDGTLDFADKETARATGVFWLADEDKFRMTIDQICAADGSGQTMLYAETMNLPLMHLAGPRKNGLNPGALDAGIGLGYKVLGLVKRAQPSLFLNGGSKATSEYEEFFSPNSNVGTAVGKWPTASSMHRGVVNVVFVDGHCSTITRDIDWTVWASLHTPAGMRHGEKSVAEVHY